jgi:D-glycerate 3-kinase
LKEVNSFLRSYDALHQLVGAWVVLQVQDPTVVYTWRLQAERAMIAAGKSGLTDMQVRDFVDRFMPAYRAFLPALYAKGPPQSDEHGPVLCVRVREDRTPCDARSM